jgi:hypothetical protein
MERQVEADRYIIEIKNRNVKARDLQWREIVLEAKVQNGL